MTQAIAQPRGRQLSRAIPVHKQAAGHRHSLLILGGLTAFALGLRLFQIAHEPMWLDEGYTLLFSRLPLDRLFAVGGAHEHPPLYYLIVHLLLRLHDSYLVARAVAAVAGALSVAVLYLLGTRIFNHVAAFTAAALLAISPFHVWYSQEARAYELAGLLVLLSYLSLFTALDKPRRLIWAVYAACTALALFAEYTTAFVLLPQGLLLLRARRTGLTRPLLVAWLGAGLALAPWLGMLARDTAEIAEDYWIPLPTPDLVGTTVLEFLGLATPCPRWPCAGSEAPFVPGHELLLAGIAVALAGAALAAALLRRDLTLTVLAGWLLLPFGLIFLIALRRSLYLDRVFLDVTFPLYLLLGAALARFARHARAALPVALAVAVVAAGSVVDLKPVYADTSNPDWKSAARDFQAAYRPGQSVVFNPGVLRTLVGTYLPPGWHAAREQPLWFHRYLDVPGWQKRYARLVDARVHDGRLTVKRRYTLLDADLRNAQMTAATTGVRQVWLITENYAGTNDTRRWLLVHGFHPLVGQVYSGETRIELWDRLLPRNLGPAVMRDDGFGRAWSRSGSVVSQQGVALENGHTVLSRSFPVVPGVAYSVSLELQALPPAGPSVSVEVYDGAGALLTRFPRTEWYDLPVNGAWLTQPFGFVAPPGSAHAVLRLRNAWGQCYWRHLAVYRQR